ncbi:MAG: DUF1851 domain-containing protein [Flavobacterium sp.]|nr:MAG: DUF1851 domain-containing protein [Flavobacterium sp.]
MTIDYHQFIKEISKIDLDDICSDWQWLLNNMYTPIIVSCSGDMFLIDENKSIYWLDTGTGTVLRIADDMHHFNLALNDLDNIDKWFLASVVLDLIEKGMILKENQVYSYKLMPILNGNYSLDNFEMTDMSVHFSMTGQICRKVKDLPDGTKIKVSIQPPNYSDFI